MRGGDRGGAPVSVEELRALEAVLALVGREVRRVLERRLGGEEIGVDEAVLLCGARGADLHALVAVADHRRRVEVGDTVGYVVNRNINFTNVCVKACRFCAFSRTRRSEEGYFLPTEEIVRRALEARELGATEVCIQAGLAPGVDGRFYVDLVRALKAAAPDLHLHAFSPEEVKYVAGLRGLSIRAVLEELRDAGLGSLPGTSAEVLDDRVRARIAPGRIRTAEWIEVVTTAHALGLPTTSTLMYGHVESDLERVRHLDLLRSIQRETGGFTEFVPLSFVHEEAPMTLRQNIPDLRPGPTGNEVVRLYAIARLLLGGTIRNLQVSWVKEGTRLGQWLLSCGANDLGGTLMNESISTAAGAAHGQFRSPAELRRLVRDAGRVPVQRSTRYEPLRTFSAEPSPDEEGPLDRVDDVEARFG
ncbi:MAG: 5-amino-6-(D-ribitylamino)uracil--L-tyrosine 4-hydroxyphenyl transferase CofH, partial [Myxococcales bacterium]|nr:5-amino-6-(D-ribitylamino)uracil--L-tyrosine 4-hydroxyphenyl transferase CofH [Myxococcales bacterium]